jgi:hypothetical protein
MVVHLGLGVVSIALAVLAWREVRRVARRDDVAAVTSVSPARDLEHNQSRWRLTRVGSLDPGGVVGSDTAWR